MKKKTLLQITSVTLAFVTALTSVPAANIVAYADEVAEVAVEEVATEEVAEETTEEVAEPQDEEIVTDVPETEEAEEIEIDEETIEAADEEIVTDDAEEGEQYFVGSDLNIFELDWKNASDEEINKYIGFCDDSSIAAWVSSLTAEEKEELMARDTDFNKTLDYYGIGCNDCGIEWGSHFETSMEYYEKIANCKKKQATYKFQSTNGTVNIKFYLGNSELPEKTSKVKMSNISLSTLSNVYQEELVCTIIDSAYSLTNPSNADTKWRTFNITNDQASFDKQLAKVKENGSDSINYLEVAPNITFVKPECYTMAAPKYISAGNSTTFGLYATRDIVSGKVTKGVCCLTNKIGAIDNYSSQKVNAYLGASLSKDFGVGSKDASSGSIVVPVGSISTVEIRFNPLKYKIKYNLNGATGNVSDQEVSYKQTYTYPTVPNTGAPGYAVSFDANGGVATETSKTFARAFAGWADSANMTSGATGNFVADACKTNGGTVTKYATWGNATATFSFPSATRTGYKFISWDNTHKAGATYNSALTGNKTFKAVWNPISYSVKLNSPLVKLSNGKNDLTIKTNYDANVTLPSLERTGYKFLGWRGTSDLYTAGNIKNLTDVDGATVELTAEWEAQEVEYKVEYHLATDTDGKNFKLHSSETLKGLADSQINVPAKDFPEYVTPEQQLITVNPDGTTVVVFKYLKERQIVIPSNTGAQEKLDAIIAKLNKIDTIASLSKDDWEALKTLISSTTGLTADMSKKLEDVIKNSTLLSEKDKKDILAALAEGVLSDDLREKLINAISKSTLSEADKAVIISAIRSMSNLSLQEQVRIRELLEKGSSVTYKINGITFEIKKNDDGTLSVILKELNGLKDVIIPDSVTVAGKTYAVTEIANYAFHNNKTVETVKMGNNITKIGDGAFEGCTNLKSVVIGPNVKEIGAKAFKGCTALTSVDIPASVLIIGDSAFENCTKLKVVTLHDGLLRIGKKAFYNCKALTKIKIPRTVIQIKSFCFGKDIKLAKVTFGNDPLLVTMSPGVFSDCKMLTKFDVPKRLKSLPDQTFKNCSKLSKVTGGAALTRIGNYAFENCKKLGKYTVNSKVQTIGKKAFYNCKSLKEIKIKSQALTSVGKNAAKKCNAKLKIVCPTNKTAAYSALWKGKC